MYKSKHFFSAKGFLMVIAIFLIAPLSASAYINSQRQEINITINSDKSAQGTWGIPMPPQNGTRATQMFLPVFDDYGSAVSTSYVLTGVLDESKNKVPFFVAGDGLDYINLMGANHVPLVDIYANYTLQPAFTDPVSIYEVWMDDGSFRQSPIITATYPSTWKVLDVWPNNFVSNQNKITLEYPASYLDVKPVLMVFQTNPTASTNGALQIYGKYTITGSKEDVKKIQMALSKLGFVDDLMNQTIGIKPPANILIVSDDMTKSGAVGYEVQALATRPNLLVYNNQLIKNQSVNEIAENLAHEFLHLALFNQGLFNGRSYNVPWFDEGLAVFFQTKAHTKLFTDTNERILNEELDRTNIVSPAEASVLYESNFDFSFDGSRHLGTIGSYKHAGIVFANFYNKVGSSGFLSLFKQLVSNQGSFADSTYASDTILNTMKSIANVSRNDLLYPGKSTDTVASVISKIERPENDENQVAKNISDYIKNTVRHYFSQ